MKKHKIYYRDHNLKKVINKISIIKNIKKFQSNKITLKCKKIETKIVTNNIKLHQNVGRLSQN